MSDLISCGLCMARFPVELFDLHMQIAHSEKKSATVLSGSTHPEWLEAMEESARGHLLANILDYLSRQRVSMWGRTYYLHDDDGIQKAAEWLLSVIEEVQNARSNVEFHPGSPRTDLPEVPKPSDGRSVDPRSGDLHLGAFLRSSHD